MATTQPAKKLVRWWEYLLLWACLLTVAIPLGLYLIDVVFGHFGNYPFTTTPTRYEFEQGDVVSVDSGGVIQVAVAGCDLFRVQLNHADIAIVEGETQVLSTCVRRDSEQLVQPYFEGRATAQGRAEVEVIEGEGTLVILSDPKGSVDINVTGRWIHRNIIRPAMLLSGSLIVCALGALALSEYRKGRRQS